MAGFDVHDRRFNTSTAIVLMRLKNKTPKDFWVLVDIPEASRTLFALPESLLVLPQVTLNALHTIQGLFSLELSGAPVPREISLLFANIGQKLVPPSGEHLWIDQAQLPDGSQVLLPISEVLGSVCSALSDESMWSAEKIKENHQKFKKALLEQIDFDRCGTLFRNELVAILTSIDYPGVQVFRNFREFLAVKTDQFILTELTKRWDSDPFSTAKMFFNYFHAKNTVQELDFFELLFSNRPPQEKMKLCLELRKFIQQELIALGYLDEHLKATHPEIAVDIATLTSYIGDVHLRDSNQIFLSALTLKEDGPFVKEIVIQKATEAYYSRNLEDKIPAYLASRPLVLPENHPFTRLYALVTDYPEMKITSVFQGFYEGLWLETKESSKDDKITLLLANMPEWQRIYLTQEDPSIPETFSGSKADLIDSIETTWKESYPAALQDKLISDIRSLRTLFIQVKTEESWLSSVKEVPTRLKPEAVDMVSSILLEIQTRNLEKGTQLILDLMGKKKALMRLMEKRYGDIARLPEQENISYFLARVSELDGLTSIEEFDRLVDKLNQRGFQALIDNFIQTYSSGMYLSIENFFAKCRTAEARDQKKLWDEYFSYEAKEDNFLEHVLKLRNKDGEILVGPYHIARVFLMAVTTPRATWSDALSSAVPLVREFVQKQDAGLEGSVRQTSYPPHFFAFLASDPGAWLRTMPEAFQAMMNLYGSEQDQQRACEFFVYFSYKNPDNQSKIAEIPGMLEALKNGLAVDNEDLKISLLAFLGNLMLNNDSIMQEILEMDLKSTLIRLFYNASSEKTKSPFSWALSHLIPRMSPDDLTKSASEELKKSLEQFIPYLNEEGKKSVEVNLRKLIELESARAEAAVDVSKKTAAINTGAKLAPGEFSAVLKTSTLQVASAIRALTKYREQNPHKDFTNLNTKDPGVLRYRKLEQAVFHTDKILNQEGLTEERKGFMFNKYFDSVVKNIVSGKDYNPFFHRKRQSGLDTLLQKEMSDFMGASVDSLSTSVSPSPRSSMSTPFRFSESPTVIVKEVVASSF